MQGELPPALFLSGFSHGPTTVLCPDRLRNDLVHPFPMRRAFALLLLLPTLASADASWWWQDASGHNSGTEQCGTKDCAIDNALAHQNSAHSPFNSAPPAGPGIRHPYCDGLMTSQTGTVWITTQQRVDNLAQGSWCLNGGTYVYNNTCAAGEFYQASGGCQPIVPTSTVCEDDQGQYAGSFSWAGAPPSGDQCVAYAGSPTGGCWMFVSIITYQGSNTLATSGTFGGNVSVVNGTSCTPGVDSPDPNVAGPCPSGSTAGQINGVDVCVPQDTGGTTTTQQQQYTPPAGGGGSLSDPAPGSTVTTTQTSTTSGGGGALPTSTTTTTTTNYDPVTGEPTSVTTQQVETIGDEPSELENFCVENPDTAICQGPGSFSGTCGGFTCEGDAVDCAIALEIHNRNCEIFTEPFPGADQTGLLDASLTEALDPGTDLQAVLGEDQVDITDWFLVSDFLGATQTCPPDLVINVLGSDVNVPFDTMCALATLVAPLIILASMLLGARLIYTGI